MFCEETYGLISCLDCLDHVPDGSVFSYEISFAKFSDLIVRLAFVSFDNVSEIIELERIFGLVVSGLFFLFLIVVLVGFVPLNLGNSGDGVSIHIVVKLGVFHLFGDHGVACSCFQRGKLGRVDNARSYFTSNLV